MWIRAINNTIELFGLETHTRMANLSSDLDRQTLNECHSFINRVKEARHQNTLECQRTKFNRLWHKS